MLITPRFVLSVQIRQRYNLACGVLESSFILYLNIVPVSREPINIRRHVTQFILNVLPSLVLAFLLGCVHA